LIDLVDPQVVIISVFKHKTGSLGPAFLTIHDMRLYEIMKLYAKHIRIEFLKLGQNWKKAMKDIKLTFFLNNEGKRCSTVDSAMKFFKRQFINEGIKKLASGSCSTSLPLASSRTSS
jgi:hypothetical protein